MRLAALLFGLIFAIPALAQQGNVRQSGNVTPNHPAMWIAPSIIGDAGTSANGGLSTLGITAVGDTPFSINDGPSTGPYSSLSLGINPTNSGLISVDAHNGDTPRGLKFRINGNLSSFSFNPDGTPNVTPLSGIITTTVHFNDAPAPATTGGAIQSLRNIALVAPTANTANKPFFLQNTFTGINLDPPSGSSPMFATSITNNFNNFNTGQLGARGLGVTTSIGPLSVGATYSAVTSSVIQSAPFPPGTNQWAVNTVYAANAGVTNPNNQLTYYAVTGGTSAPSGTGPSGQGQAIVDGTVTWAYQGPGIPAYWAQFTSYPTQGVMVTNPNNGGLFRVEVPGTSGASPGPPRPRSQLVPVRLASTGNMSLSGTPVVDSVQSVIGDRVLAKDETSAPTNGVYIVASGAWTRAADADTWGELVSRFTSVTAGTVNAGTGWLCNVVAGGTLGTTPVTWIASVAPNPNAIPDGSVVWSLRSVGAAATSFIGLIANATASFNAGGKSFNETVGTQWGAVIGSRTLTNATFMSQMAALELDDNMGGSIRNINALKIVRLGKQGHFTDIGILLTAAIGLTTLDGTPVRGYKNAMMFNQSVDKDYGYGIAFEPVGLFQLQHMAGAIDTRMVVPDGASGMFGGGFVFRWSNGLLDQFGAEQMRFGSITPTASGLTIDVTNQELQSIAIGAGGASWSVADAWKGSDGSAGFVTAVDGSGAIVTVSIQIKSQQPAASLPTSITLSPFDPEATYESLGNDPVPGTVGPTGDPVWPTAATGTPTYAAPTNPQITLGSTITDVRLIGGSVAQNATIGFAHPFGLISTGAPSGTPALTTVPACVINPTPSPAVIDCYIAGSWQHLTFTAGAG